MSVLNKLFGKKKTPDTEQSVGLSLAMPDDLTALPRGPGAEKADTLLQDVPAPAPVDQEELVSVPLLGRRPIAEQQRLLWWLLGLGLVMLGAIAFVALTAADRVAQQLNATGQSLMQSQRLAKSVSQAWWVCRRPLPRCARARTTWSVRCAV